MGVRGGGKEGIGVTEGEGDGKEGIGVTEGEGEREKRERQNIRASNDAQLAHL